MIKYACRPGINCYRDSTAITRRLFNEYCQPEKEVPKVYSEESCNPILREAELRDNDVSLFTSGSGLKSNLQSESSNEISNELRLLLMEKHCGKVGNRFLKEIGAIIDKS